MSLNPIAALLLAGILLLAVQRQRDDQLLALLKQEGGFVKWLIAIVILVAIYRAVPDDTKPVVGALLTLTVVGIVLENADTFKQLDALFRGQ